MDRIEKYIEEQKAILPNEYLGSRIMASIEIMEADSNRSKGLTAWQTLTIVAGFVMVVALGISLGSSYKKTYTAYLLINDNYIEQLSLYNDYAGE